ncbi:MAG TPA: DUF6062 family protein [Armatimonadota bacterium]|jgi:hypothetical protein
MEDKQATEQIVLEALTGEGCAVCRLNRSALERWIDSLLREGITDVKARLGFRTAGGLCGEHGRLLEERGNPLSVAILMRDLLTEAPPADSPREVRCAACEFLSETEARYVAALARVLEADANRARFASAPACCTPHVRRLMRRARRSVHGFLQKTLAAQHAPLAAELAEVIRKHDYRYAAEGWGDEADSWRRAVALWSGDCVAR